METKTPYLGSAPERTLETQLIQAGVTGWRREVTFHPVRRWRFDFAFWEEHLAVEVDGAVWKRGAHSFGTGITRDCEKLNEAVLLGWRVMRFTPAMVEDGTALRYIQAALKEMD